MVINIDATSQTFVIIFLKEEDVIFWASNILDIIERVTSNIPQKLEKSHVLEVMKTRLGLGR